MCRAFNKLPQDGGILNQEPILMELLLMLSVLFDSSIEIKEKEFQIELAKNSLSMR